MNEPSNAVKGEPLGSSLERYFATIWKQLGGPEYVTEYRFNPSRKWRFDVAWPDMRIAIELEGGTWMQGGHSRGHGYSTNCTKYNDAALSGWRVFRFTTDMLRDNPAGHLEPLIDLLTHYRVVLGAAQAAPLPATPAHPGLPTTADLASSAEQEHTTRRSRPPWSDTTDPQS